MLSNLFSSFFIHADAKPEESEDKVTNKDNGNDNGNGEDKAEEKPEEQEERDEGETQAEESQEGQEEEEEEEPEDPHPAIREECSNSAKCAPLKRHFDHCQEKVQGGHGFKGEECVEEMCK